MESSRESAWPATFFVALLAEVFPNCWSSRTTYSLSSLSSRIEPRARSKLHGIAPLYVTPQRSGH
eukprot:scaffold98579_cov54-Attheya_sp.AAC.1